MTNKPHDLSCFDLTDVIETIDSLPNPEQWHVKMATHPGVGWSIKTIIPSHEIAEDGMIRICDLWSMIGQTHCDLVNVTDHAYDWSGNLIDGWNTIWIRDGWDVNVTCDGGSPPAYEILPFQESSKVIAQGVLDMLSHQLAQSNTDRQDLETLADVCEALISQVSETDSQIKRKNIKVIDE